MPATNYRTWKPFRVGHFLTTIQLDPAISARNVDQFKALTSITDDLVDFMDTLRMPATWAVSDPVHSAATSRIMRSAVPHEIAILGDENWIGETAGRTRFARELLRRTTQSRAAGLSVKTLVPRVASIEGHVDLIVKQQITAIAGVEPLRAGRVTASPRALHYGVWELPVTARLPLERRWFSTGRWATWRQIYAAARDAATVHLVVDAPALSAEGASAYKTLHWLVSRIANLRDRGIVRVETMAQTAARLANVSAVKPQESILRRVA